MVCSQGLSEPPAADFEVWMERLRRDDFSMLLIHGDGGSPSSKQRARIAEYWKTSGRKTPRTAMLTNSMVTRGVLTAITWLLRDSESKAFPLDAFQDALAWLHFDGSVAEVAATVRGLHTALSMRRTA
jgi:hypothetical protein